jgi:hypothetical protein
MMAQSNCSDPLVELQLFGYRNRNLCRQKARRSATMLGNQETLDTIASNSFLITRKDEGLGFSAPYFFRFSAPYFFRFFGFIAAQVGDGGTFGSKRIAHQTLVTAL